MKRILVIALAFVALFSFGSFADRAHASGTPSITGVHMDGPILVWDTVSGAGDYVVRVYGAGGVHPTGTSLYPSYNIEEVVDDCIVANEGNDNVGWHWVEVEARATGTVIARWQGIYLCYSPNYPRATGEHALVVDMPESTYTYTGAPLTPVPEVRIGTGDSSVSLYPDTDFTLSYESNMHVGTAMATITGIDKYVGIMSIPFEIKPKDISGCVALSETSYAYNGSEQKPAVVVTDGSSIRENTDYYCSYWPDPSSKDVGTYTVIVEGAGNCTGKAELTYTIARARNALVVAGKTATVKASKLNKKAQTLKASKVLKLTNKGQGKLTYKLVSAKRGSKSFKKLFTVSAKSGKLTIKKGLKRGTYKVKIKVKASGDANYTATTKSVTIKVKVK